METAEASTANPQGAAQPRAASNRERFVAFAFCWADMILELDADRRVVYAGGITLVLVGQSPAQLKGQHIDDLVCPKDTGLMNQMLDVADKRGRFDGMTVGLNTGRGTSAPMMIAGYRHPELANHYFLGLRMSGGAGTDSTLHRSGPEKLLDATSFSKVAEQMLAKDTPGADKMTLIEVSGLKERADGLNEAERDNLYGIVGSVLKMNSAGGDAAAKIADGKYGVVHGDDVDVDAMRAQVAEAVKNVDPEGGELVVESATLDKGDTSTASPENLAKGLIFAINKFGEQSKDGVTLESLAKNMDELAKEAQETAEVFNRVVENSDFKMAYHPIVGVHDAVVHHYEALARFQGKHGESPYKYITFAEETGLISAFDLAVVDKVIDWLRERKEAGEKVSVAVNISGNSITDLRYVTGLQERLDDNPWLKEMLIFELTESARVEDLERANEFIQQIRRLGYEVCLDDFGAGAASFQYLSIIEVDVVKLDGSAIKNAQSAARGKAFLTALATFCRGLGVHTIAEMVDTHEALDFVRDCGIDYVQGFLFGKPSHDLRDFDDTPAICRGEAPPKA